MKNVGWSTLTRRTYKVERLFTRRFRASMAKHDERSSRRQFLFLWYDENPTGNRSGRFTGRYVAISPPICRWDFWPVRTGISRVFVSLEEKSPR